MRSGLAAGLSLLRNAEQHQLDAARAAASYCDSPTEHLGAADFLRDHRLLVIDRLDALEDDLGRRTARLVEAERLLRELELAAVAAVGRVPGTPERDHFSDIVTVTEEFLGWPGHDPI